MTSPLPEKGRQAAHVMLDCLSVWDAEADDMLNTSALNLTLRRLNEVGAVTATKDDDDNLTVNIDNLTAGVLISMLWFLTRLAEARGVDRSEVVNDLRLLPRWQAGRLTNRRCPLPGNRPGRAVAAMTLPVPD